MEQEAEYALKEARKSFLAFAKTKETENYEGRVCHRVTFCELEEWIGSVSTPSMALCNEVWYEIEENCHKVIRKEGLTFLIPQDMY